MRMWKNLVYSKENISTLSQAVSSGISFLITFFAIYCFKNTDFRIWFLISGVNIYLQSTNRSSFLELELLEKGSRFSGFWLSLVSNIGVNLTLCLYLIFIYPNEVFIILSLSFAYFLYQSQDILRYYFLRFGNTQFLLSDIVTFIFLGLSFFSLKIFGKLHVESYIFVYILGLLAGLIIFILPKLRIKTKREVRVRNKSGSLHLVLLATGLFSFLVMTFSFSVMAKILDAVTLKEFAIINLCLSPISSLLRLEWIRDLVKASKPKNIHPTIRAEKKIFYQISIFTAFAIAWRAILGFDRPTYIVLLCIFFGVSYIAIISSMNNEIILLRKHGNWINNLVALNIGTSIFLVYILQVFAQITLLGYFSMLLFVSVVSKLYIKKVLDSDDNRFLGRKEN